MNSFRILLWQTECNELIEMTGALQETISTAQLFTGHDRQITTARRESGGKTHFHDVLSDSTSRYEPENAKARINPPKTVSTSNQQKVTLATYSQSLPSQPGQTQVQVTSSDADQHPLEQLKEEQKTASSHNQPLAQPSNAETTAPELAFVPPSVSLSEPEPKAAQSLQVDTGVAQLTSPIVQVSVQLAQPSFPINQSKSELQGISPAELAPVLVASDKLTPPLPEANTKAASAVPVPEDGLQIDRGWVVEDPENVKSADQSGVQLPVAFSIALEAQPKAEPAIDLLRLRVHIPSKVITESVAVEPLDKDRSGIEKPGVEAIDNTSKQVSQPLVKLSAEQDPNQKNQNSGTDESETQNISAPANIMQPGKSGADKFSGDQSSPPSAANTAGIDEPQAAGRRSVSQLVLHFGESNESRVAVRVQSNALGVKMEVQGSDPQLRSSLRDSLSNLEKALDSHGVSSNWAVPGANNDKLGAPPTGQTQQESDQGANRDEARQQQGHSHRDAQEEARRRRQSISTEMASSGSWNNTLFQGAGQ